MMFVEFGMTNQHSSQNGAASCGWSDNLPVEAARENQPKHNLNADKALLLAASAAMRE